MNSLRNNLAVSIFLLCIFFAFSEKAGAATLFINPSQAEVTAGNIVNLQISVDTAGKVINNAEGIVQFPKDLLEIVSLDSKSSIFSLWVESPSFSNNIGQATFNGGVPNPGFQGSNGNIMSIVFRAKKIGTASVILLNSAVRENDGLGTDILSSKIGSEITILSGPIVQPAVDFNSILTSLSHPNQNVWYNKNSVDLSWTLPKNATAVKTLLDTYKNSEPTVYYDGQITSRSIKNIEDGIWYFHVNHLAGGIWSKTKHYKLHIDTTSPTDLSVRSEKDDAGKVTLYMKASDSLSGIDHYQVVVDSDSPIEIKADGNGEASIELPFYRSRERSVVISAFDKAGNKAETKITVTPDYIVELRFDMKVLIPIVIVLITLLLLVLYGWYKFLNLYRKVKKESHETERVVEKFFQILRKDLEEHLAKLKRARSQRELTSEEIEFIEKFDEELSEAEGVIEKKVKDIADS